MEELSDKALLKEKMSAAGLPVIPGTLPLNSWIEAKEKAAVIGYPVMLKACAGGGGRGIRLVVPKQKWREHGINRWRKVLHLSEMDLCTGFA